MTNPVIEVMQQIAADWEATTPQDRTSVGYHQVDGKQRRRSANRNFWWSLPTRDEPTGQGGVVAIQAQWTVSAHVVIVSSGRGVIELAEVIANESAALMYVVETTTAWPTNVIEVMTLGVSHEQDEESGDVILSLEFRIWAGETSVGVAPPPDPEEPAMTIHGEMHITATASTSIVGSAAAVKIGGTTASGNLLSITHTNGRLTYTGATTTVFAVIATMSTTVDSGAGVTPILSIAKNGVVETQSQISRSTKSGTSPGAVSLSGLISLAQDDYIEVFVESADTFTLTVNSMNLIIHD